MTERDKEILIAQLFAARAQIDATLAVLGVPEDGPCTHPKDEIIDISTFGAERYRCQLCGEESAQPFHTVEE